MQRAPETVWSLPILGDGEAESGSLHDPAALASAALSEALRPFFVALDFEDTNSPESAAGADRWMVVVPE